MNITEFAQAVESYGVAVPAHIENSTADNWYVKLLELPQPGSGHQRMYSNHQVRLLVAWQLFNALLGTAKNAPELRRDAARLLTENVDGYVLLADNKARWLLDPPLEAVRQGVAVVMPVPLWRH